ncbi:MFS transporter [Streptomyces sp. NPDC005727]|uniref:MFS transporter n=1 Tax=Streptomyces sp. NPDC005727 TaxID=3157053 RepID=UPI0033FD3C8D
MRDRFSGTAMTRFFSTLMVVNGAAPVVAPVIGGQLLTLTTWRAVFLVLAAVGAALLLAVVFTLPRRRPGQLPAHGTSRAHGLRLGCPRQRRAERHRFGRTSDV